uniref:Hypersuppressive rho minus mtDNA n=1 Tax=Saccharomyces cerevisiae TaxID=4932 RepID=E9P8D9_YEASX|nr:hypersuppressive rho minus mtDNA [Saccharomyces cerevisiae]
MNFMNMIIINNNNNNNKKMEKNNFYYFSMYKNLMSYIIADTVRGVGTIMFYTYMLMLL